MHTSKENTMKLTAAVPVLSSFLAFICACSVAAQQPALVSAPDIVPPATEAMQHPEFWIERIGPDAEKVIMTPAQISKLNRENLTRSLETQDINGKPYSFAKTIREYEQAGLQFHPLDPLSIRQFPGDSLRVSLARIRQVVANTNYWDRRGLPYTAAMKREILDLMGENNIQTTGSLRYGVVVTHTMNRMVPYEMPAFWGQYAWQDLFNTGALETGTPVAVLHVSTDGAWCYIRSEYAYGWISAVNVAFGTPDQIRRLTEPKNFIVALLHKIPVFADQGFQTLATEIYQCARLPLMEKTTAGYRVLVPHRKADGSLEIATGWLRPDADVSVGYQPFTQANAIRTMFRLLNRPYGWGNSCNERDCCGAIRTVLRTFGFDVPYGTSHELHSTDHVICFPKETPKDVKYKQLDTCEPGITMCGFDGHIVMYLGKVDNSYFVIHSNGYSYHDKDGTEIRIGRVGVCDTEIEGGSYIGEWTELTTFKP